MALPVEFKPNNFDPSNFDPDNFNPGDFNPENYRRLLGIADNNALLLANSRIRTADSTERSSHLLKEIDQQSNLVAHYRVWIHLSAKPPFREQRGWEKYSPDGRLLDREVRYSRQTVATVLH